MIHFPKALQANSLPALTWYSFCGKEHTPGYIRTKQSHPTVIELRKL